MAYKSVRATTGGRDVRRVRRQTRPSATPATTSVRATTGGRGVRQEQRQTQLTSPFRRKARRLRRRYKAASGGALMLPKGQIEAEIRNRREARREEEADKSIVERQLEHGVVGFVDKDVSDVGRSVVFGSENPSLGDLGKTVALTAALGPAGKVAGAGLKIAKASKAGQAASKAKTAAKAAPKTAAKKTASKAPKPVKSAAAKATRATQKAAKSKPAKAAGKAYKSKAAAPVRVPLRVTSRNPGKTTLVALEGPAAVEATRTGDASKLKAPIEGTARAVIESPRKTAGTTLRTLPGLVTAPVGIAQNVGLSGYRSARSEAVPDVLGGGKYSTKEVTEPTRRAGKAIGDFAKRYHEVYGSGDPEVVKKATEDEFGIGMALPLVGALRGKARRGHVEPESGAGKIPLVRNRRKRKGTSRHVTRGKRQATVRGMAMPDELDRITGHQGKRTLTKKTPDGRRREQVIPAAASTGATHPRHLVADAAARNRGARNPGAAKGTTTRHDVARDARRDPDILKDKQVQEGLELVRREQPEIETSDVKKWEGVMVTAGIKHPWERKGYTKKDPDLLTAAESRKNAKLEADAVAEADAWARADGRTEPVYMQSVDARKVPPGKGETGGVRGTAGRSSHRLDLQSSAGLNRAGLEDVSYETFRVRSGFEPRSKRELNKNTAQFLEDETYNLPVRGKQERFVTEKEKNALIAAETWTDPRTGKKVNADDVIWIDAQTGKAAVRSKEDQPEVDVFEEALSDAVTRRELQAKAGLDVAKGKKYFAVDRVKGEEFLSQHGRLRENALQKFGQGALPTQRAASRALLGYSPSWLLAQPIAETAQALAAVGPVNLYKGHKRYKKMSPELQRQFDAGIGGTAGTGSIYEAMTNVRSIARSTDGRNAVTRGWRTTNQALLSHPAGRVAQGLMTGRYANNLDRRKGLAIRRAVAAGHLGREFNGLSGAINRFRKEQDRLDQQMRNKTPQQRIEWAAKNPKQLAKLEGYVDDVMGNWSALTTNERALSGAVIFYPFVRMSLEWTVLTFPARHPLKAATMHFLAQQNAEQVERMLGGKPSFFTQWASAPLYAGRDEELGEPTGLIPLHRIAPGSNALVEAAGSGSEAGPRDVFRAINPIGAAALAAAGAYDPQTGRSNLEKYEKPSFTDFARSFGGSLATLPAPVRVADLTQDRKLSRKLEGKPLTPTTMLFDVLGGGTKERVIRSLVPFIPANTQRERQEAEIGRLLERKFAAQDLDFFEDIRPAVIKATKGGKSPKGSEAEEMVVRYLDALVAQNQLRKIQEQYGIPQAKELKGRAANLAQATSETVIGGRWNEILKDALGWREDDVPTGLKLTRLKKLRRARARSLMGSDND